jgi:DME family drug/metabolite transporter
MWMTGGKKTNWSILAPLLVFLAGLAWGLIGLFSYELRRVGLTPLQVTHWRDLVAGGTLFLYLLFRKRELLKIRLRDAWMFIGTGVLSVALFNIFFFICMQESTMAVAVTLLHTSPIFLMIFSVLLFKEKFTLTKGIATVLAAVGSVFITGMIGGGAAQITGRAFWFGILSGLFYSLYTVFGRFALRRYSWLTVITYTFVFAIIALFPLSDFPRMIELTFSESKVALSMVILGLFSTLMPFLLYTKGLEHMEVSKAALLTFVEPTVGMLVSVLVFNEYFSIDYAIGLILIVTAIIVLNGPWQSSPRCKEDLDYDGLR